MDTIRQRIIACLEDRPMNSMDISQEIGIMEKEVFEHLSHIAQSSQAQGKRLVIHPSKCLKCGYIFEGRKRFTRPGKCPKCKATRVQRPEYQIVGRLEHEDFQSDF